MNFLDTDLYDRQGKAISNVKHWHGAAADSWFSHLAIEIEGEDTSNEWCESVTDEDYLKIQ
jgi:4-carboxymuconolactone decarboxylase